MRQALLACVMSLGVLLTVGIAGLARVDPVEAAGPVPTQQATEMPSDFEAGADIREAVDSVWAVPTMVQDGLNGHPVVYTEE